METTPTIQESEQHHKYFFYIGLLFVAVLMIANTAAVKLIEIGPLAFSGTIVIFPISYIFGDILTEVYGYRASRKIVWSGFVILIFMSFCYWLIDMLPPAAFWPHQEAFHTILGAAPRIVLASIVAYFAGEFTNSYVLSKMKIWSQGKNLWMRTIGSTVVGEGVDTALFVLIAFGGLLPNEALWQVAISAYIVKVAYEVILTPVTYKIVGWLKRAEGIDVYDRGINYNPFALKG
jgi:queuosine precursor transporter